MKFVIQTKQFEQWLIAVKDFKIAKIIKREIDKLKLGIMSHTKSLGEGLFELKIHTSKGIRVYFINQNEQIIIILAGGDKITQQKDIAKARKLKKDIETDECLKRSG